MKKKKILIIGGVLVALILAIIFITVTKKEDVSLTPIITGREYNESFDYNKLMMNINGTQQVVETEDGYYSSVGGGYLYFIDKKTGKATIVCNLPNCNHDNPETCPGYINTNELHLYDGKLYYSHSYEGARYVWSIDLDGNNKKRVQMLEDNYNYFFADNDSFIIHRGIVYYPISTGEIMANKLGADMKNAVSIFKEVQDEAKFMNGMQVVHDNIARQMLYADGDYIYLRAIIEKDDGYVETFFRYNALTRKSEKIFEIPSEDVVGSWEEAGVKSEGWYITGNKIYYFLSGNGLWKYDMETKENSKVIDTKDKGFGSIDGKYLYINNGNDLGSENYGMFETRRDTITKEEINALSIKVYDIETGEYVGEIKYSEIFNDKNYDNFKIGGFTKDKILLRADGFFGGGDIYYYASRTDIKNAKFEKTNFND